ncbi:hypothetical protein GCM10028771_36660 [Nocardioides marmoraquaticus]
MVVDLALVALAVALVVAVVLTWRSGPATPTDRGAADGPGAAAGAEVVAFLEVDHTDMDAVTGRVLDGATGGFREEYGAGRDRLVARVEQRRAVVDASLRAVGVVEQSSSDAVVLVAADSRVVDRDTGDGTGDDPVQRRDRLRVGLERVDGRWLVSRLEYVR